MLTGSESFMARVRRIALVRVYAAGTLSVCKRTGVCHAAFFMPFFGKKRILVEEKKQRDDAIEVVP